MKDTKDLGWFTIALLKELIESEKDIIRSYYLKGEVTPYIHKFKIATMQKKIKAIKELLNLKPITIKGAVDFNDILNKGTTK